MHLLKNKNFYIGLFVFLILVFVGQNARPIEINFLFWNLIKVNFFFIVFIFFGLGFLTGFLVSKKSKKSSKVNLTSSGTKQSKESSFVKPVQGEHTL